MVSIEKITEKFKRLDEFLAILKGMQSTPLDTCTNSRRYALTISSFLRKQRTGQG